MDRRTDAKVHELDFVDFAGIDQFVEDMDFDLLLGASLHDHDASDFRPNPGDPLGFGCADPNSIQGSFSGSVEDEEDEEGENETEQSCGSAGVSSSSKKARLDRTRTLVCERKRRGKMKEKLYALRALVPNITKMDKASIVGDAMLYVQHMQMEANKLKAEIADLESDSKASSRCLRLPLSSENDSIGRVQVLEPKIITQMEIFQVDKGEYHIRIKSEKGRGVAVSLYQAFESLSIFIVQSSSLNGVCEGFVLTLTIKVEVLEEDMDAPNLKMMIIRALISHGFEVRED